MRAQQADPVMDLEHHQLILRYEHLRVRCPERERRLLAALAEHGQQMPIVVVASEESGRFVVVDGYKRIRAMRRLGCDVVRAACWDLEEAEALLLGRLMRTAAEETAFEQGLWLREMHQRFGLSLEDLARRFDRSTSWVSRRLALVRDLPETIQARVLRGEIAPHAAMKGLVPLARANPEGCERLVEAIAGKKLSTRQIADLVAAFRSGGARTRALVLADPLLVLKARGERREPSAGERPLPGAELLHDFDVLASVARRALKRLCEGAIVRLAAPEREEVFAGFHQVEREMDRLRRQVGKEREDAGSGAEDGDPGAASAGPGGPGDREGDGDRPRDGAQGGLLRLFGGAADGASGEGRAVPRADPGSLRELQGQPGAGA
jgi:ParB/RepB/Spo0J family partition protein